MYLTSADTRSRAAGSLGELVARSPLFILISVAIGLLIVQACFPWFRIDEHRFTASIVVPEAFAVLRGTQGWPLWVAIALPTLCFIPWILLAAQIALFAWARDTKDRLNAGDEWSRLASALSLGAVGGAYIWMLIGLNAIRDHGTVAVVPLSGWWLTAAGNVLLVLFVTARRHILPAGEHWDPDHPRRRNRRLACAGFYVLPILATVVAFPLMAHVFLLTAIVAWVVVESRAQGAAPTAGGASLLALAGGRKRLRVTAAWLVVFLALLAIVVLAGSGKRAQRRFLLTAAENVLPQLKGGMSKVEVADAVGSWTFNAGMPAFGFAQVVMYQWNYKWGRYGDWEPVGDDDLYLWMTFAGNKLSAVESRLPSQVNQNATSQPIVNSAWRAVRRVYLQASNSTIVRGIGLLVVLALWIRLRARLATRLRDMERAAANADISGQGAAESEAQFVTSGSLPRPQAVMEMREQGFHNELAELDAARRNGLLTQEEYDDKRRRLLRQL